MVFRTMIFSSKRIPLIKFRKGGHHTAAAGAESTSQTSTTLPHTVQTESYSANAIEDWELPARYRRQAISADEMEYINRGGPA